MFFKTLVRRGSQSCAHVVNILPNSASIILPTHCVLTNNTSFQFFAPSVQDSVETKGLCHPYNPYKCFCNRIMRHMMVKITSCSVSSTISPYFHFMDANFMVFLSSRHDHEHICLWSQLRITL